MLTRSKFEGERDVRGSPTFTVPVFYRKIFTRLVEEDSARAQTLVLDAAGLQAAHSFCYNYKNTFNN